MRWDTIDTIDLRRRNVRERMFNLEASERFTQLSSTAFSAVCRRGFSRYVTLLLTG